MHLKAGRDLPRPLSGPVTPPNGSRVGATLVAATTKPPRPSGAMLTVCEAGIYCRAHGRLRFQFAEREVTTSTT